MGIIINGGVHSSNEHIFGLLELAKQQGLDKVYVHAFLDGRDVAPDSGVDFVKELQEKLKKSVLDKLHQFLVDTMQWTEIKDLIVLN